ncbi:COX15/CtaA family protein [Hoyosella altamirensis]|uniref:Cytochrome c oxidase assembly protein subunit 15 n=1 Tax=Hoyosella altamirensis TaxID=616997 RepID=A0A839RVT5_9ACTN|nr:heme A synthase [Hoyosella altamirensis]MBB3039881.1 cytochrome c oxidase assembly protein subunit 15 [Hoyosella altamirensis]
MLSRTYLSLVDRLPMPSLRTQKIVAILVILTQAGIAVTGSVVRVTASGLGCPTWPQCFPGSFTPVPVEEVATLHQLVEFGNRLLTFVVVAAAVAIVLVVTRARRRREVIAYAWVMPLSTLMQAVIGGITVLTGLLWWTVAVHLLVSMAMVWVAVVLYNKISEPDEGVDRPVAPRPLRSLTALTAVALVGVLVAGTMVTGAGPHAGDPDVDRLEVEIVTLVHLHSQLTVAYAALLIGLVFALYAVAAPRNVLRNVKFVIAIASAQAALGIVQYFLQVPAYLIPFHIAGAAACTAATAALWSSMSERVTSSLPMPPSGERVPERV